MLLRLCKGVSGSGRVVILDSGFCVLEGIVELRKIGVYAGALIKKRRYWSKNIAGEDEKEYMSNKAVSNLE